MAAQPLVRDIPVSLIFLLVIVVCLQVLASIANNVMF